MFNAMLILLLMASSSEANRRATYFCEQNDRKEFHPLGPCTDRFLSCRDGIAEEFYCSSGLKYSSRDQKCVASFLIPACNILAPYREEWENPINGGESRAFNLTAQQDQMSRIFHGEIVPPTQFTSTVALLHLHPIDGMFRFYCSAVVIHREFALSSAHCIHDSAETYFIRSGIDGVKEGGTDHKIKGIKFIDQFGTKIGCPHCSDAVVIRVWPPFKVSDRLSIETFRPSNEHPKSCKVIGWGLREKDAQNKRKVQDRRYQVEVTPLHAWQCKEKMKDFIKSPHKDNGLVIGFDEATMLCAEGKTPEMGPCHGDSGGPLMCRYRGSNDYFLHGLVSWGYDCDPKFPNVYTYLNPLRHEINDVINKKEQVEDYMRRPYAPLMPLNYN